MFYGKAGGELYTAGDGVVIATLRFPLTVTVFMRARVLNEASMTEVQAHGLTEDERRAIAIGICPELADEHARLLGEIAKRDQAAADALERQAREAGG
jgi:hypothetical protein